MFEIYDIIKKVLWNHHGSPWNYYGNLSNPSSPSPLGRWRRTAPYPSGGWRWLSMNSFRKSMNSFRKSMKFLRRSMKCLRKSIQTILEDLCEILGVLKESMNSFRKSMNASRIRLGRWLHFMKWAGDATSTSKQTGKDIFRFYRIASRASL